MPHPPQENSWNFFYHRDSTASDATPVQPPTPPSTPADGGFVPDAPIVFDMISPSDETKHMPGDMEGPQK